MEWSRLFSVERIGKTQPLLDESPKSRSEFQIDLDRIVFSSAFRRLQNKTQVIPIPGSDFVHTRLTHSLETFCVGRSLGQIVGREICKQNHISEDPDDIATIVATACMAHDIGNTPLGHSGEEVISEFFKNEGKEYIQGLSDNQKSDFEHFDGNALGFHILTHSLVGHTTISGGLRLTHTTLASFTKYPNESSISSKYKRNEDKHKYGIFQSEIEVFNSIAENLGLIRYISGKNEWCRHPLAFLVEAADDICYHVIDFEDAYRMGLIDFDTSEKLLSRIDPIDKNRYKSIKDNNEKIAYLRAKAINVLVNQVTDSFIDNIDKIISGEYLSPLIESVRAFSTLKAIKQKTLENMYNERTVIETETAGYECIKGLLERFISAVMSEKKLKYHEKIISLIPTQFLNNKGYPSKDAYSDIMNITHFIAGMTDTYLIDLYRIIMGISLPNY